jgi:hypothetical protein
MKPEPEIESVMAELPAFAFEGDMEVSAGMGFGEGPDEPD